MLIATSDPKIKAILEQSRTCRAKSFWRLFSRKPRIAARPSNVVTA